MISIDVFNKKIMYRSEKLVRRFHLLAFDLQDEKSVLSTLLRYTGNFVVLKLCDDDINLLCKNLKLYEVKSENAAGIVANIFRDELQYISHESQAILIKEKRYILFTTVYEDGYRLRVEEKSISIDVLRVMEFKRLIKVCSQFYLSNLIFINTDAVVYLEAREINEPSKVCRVIEGEEQTLEQVFLLPFYGLGDHFIFHSLLEEFIAARNVKTEEVYLVCDRKEHNDILLNKMFPGQEKLMFDNNEMYKYCCRNGKFVNFYSSTNFWFELEQGKKLDKHIIELMKNYLNIESAFQPYLHADKLKNIIDSNCNSQEAEIIDNLDIDQAIGIQYFTGFYDSNENIWVESRNRSLNYGNICKLISFFKQNGHTVLLLNPNPYPESLDAIQLPKLSVFGYVYAIKKLKIMVGIDSSAGHIASFYNIPSLTMWGNNNTPYTFNNFPFSFRALRKNCSIYSETGNVNQIDMELVFKTAIKIIDGSLPLSEEIFEYQNQKNVIISDEFSKGAWSGDEQ